VGFVDCVLYLRYYFLSVDRYAGIPMPVVVVVVVVWWFGDHHFVWVRIVRSAAAALLVAGGACTRTYSLLLSLSLVMLRSW